MFNGQRVNLMMWSEMIKWSTSETVNLSPSEILNNPKKPTRSKPRCRALPVWHQQCPINWSCCGLFWVWADLSQFNGRCCPFVRSIAWLSALSRQAHSAVNHAETKHCRFLCPIIVHFNLGIPTRPWHCFECCGTDKEHRLLVTKHISTARVQNEQVVDPSHQGLGTIISFIHEIPSSRPGSTSSRLFPS